MIIERSWRHYVILSSDKFGTRLALGEKNGDVVESKIVLAQTKDELRHLIQTLRGFIDDMPDGG